MIKDIIGVPNPIKHQEGGDLTEELKKFLEERKKQKFVNKRPIPGVPIIQRFTNKDSTKDSTNDD